METASEMKAVFLIRARNRVESGALSALFLALCFSPSLSTLFLALNLLTDIFKFNKNALNFQILNLFNELFEKLNWSKAIYG